MIAGFNTDIEIDGIVYHVQTEDKGAPARVIMSLVYDRGTILASKRSSYDDLPADNLDEKELGERLSRQHKLFCAAVKAGRIDDLKAMTAKTASAGAKAKAEAIAAMAETPMPTEPIQVTAVPLAPVTRIDNGNPTMPLPVARVETARVVHITPPDTFEEELVIDAVHIIEDDGHEIFFPAEAVEVVSELSGKDRPANSKLSLEILGETKFKGGDRRTVNIMICRGTDRKVVPDSQIMIKVIGSAFRPVIFHAKSDANGLARVHLQLPQFHAGRAALLIRAITGGEEIELRRIVTPS